MSFVGLCYTVLSYSKCTLHCIGSYDKHTLHFIVSYDRCTLYSSVSYGSCTLHCILSCCRCTLYRCTLHFLVSFGRCTLQCIMSFICVHYTVQCPLVGEHYTLLYAILCVHSYCFSVTWYSVHYTVSTSTQDCGSLNSSQCTVFSVQSTVSNVLLFYPINVDIQKRRILLNKIITNCPILHCFPK